jgi:hypothetical protein
MHRTSRSTGFYTPITGTERTPSTDRRPFFTASEHIEQVIPVTPNSTTLGIIVEEVVEHFLRSSISNILRGAIGFPAIGATRIKIAVLPVVQQVMR